MYVFIWDQNDIGFSIMTLKAETMKQEVQNSGKNIFNLEFYAFQTINQAQG